MAKTTKKNEVGNYIKTRTVIEVDGFKHRLVKTRDNIASCANCSLRIKCYEEGQDFFFYCGVNSDDIGQFSFIKE